MIRGGKRCIVAATLFAAMGLSAPGANAVKVGEQCAGFAGDQCDKGLWCDLQAGMCKGADIAGTCIEVPEKCTLEYAPVCGCDGKTYSNDCTRQGAKVALDHKGECKKDEKAK